MQDNTSSVVPSSNLSPSELNGPLASTYTAIHSSIKLPLEGNIFGQNGLEGSSLWARKLTASMISQRFRVFSNIKSLDKEEQKAVALPFLNHFRLTEDDKKFSTISPMISRKANQLVHLFSTASNFKEIHDSQLTETKIETEFMSNNQVLTDLQPAYPICLSSQSASHLINLSDNLRRTYERGQSFGPLEKAHMEWMGKNEITADRAAYIRRQKLSMYRNFIFQGSSAGMRYTLLNEFLMRKDLYPKKEPKSFIPESLDKTFKDAVNKCESWYKQGQSLAMGILNRKNKTEAGDDSLQKGLATSLLPELEGQTITIDWDKAFHHALRSHSIAHVLGIPPQVLFLTGFAAIDMRQIILSNDLENIEKLILIAQIVLKTLLKIIVVIGTQLFTSGVLGLGGIDVINIPLGVHGERYLEKQLTSRVFSAIDSHFDSIKSKTDDIVDC